jgi:hypothetical protein
MTPILIQPLRGAAIALFLLSAHAALAQQPPAASREILWRTECGSCHVAYPPQLLAAADWRTLMARLERHFGDDASVDAAIAADIGSYLEAHAGRRSGGQDAGLPRITRGRWFTKEHREIARQTWHSPKVKSAANCTACHPNAAQGDFDDDDIRIPR